MFFIFSLLAFSNIKETKTKNALFFVKPLLTPRQPAKKIFSHPYTLFVLFKDTQKNTIKLGENKQKTILDRFSTQPWTDFRLKKGQILDRFSTLQLLFSKNFHSRPGWGQKSLLGISGVGGGGQTLIVILSLVWNNKMLVDILSVLECLSFWGFF